MAALSHTAENMTQMSTEQQESAADCTGTAHSRRIPDWLRPYKDEWLSAGKLKALIAAEGQYFGPWFEGVRHRIRSVTVRGQNGKDGSRYLVRHVWAAALAHDLRLIPTDRSQPLEALRARVGDLERELAQERSKVRREYIEVDRTADSLEIFRLLVAAGEPKPLPGVYFLLDADGDVLYVGQSRNVLSRMAGHTEKRYARVRMIHVEDDKRRLVVEGKMILWFQPPLNLSGLGKSPFRAKGMEMPTRD